MKEMRLIKGLSLDDINAAINSTGGFFARSSDTGDHVVAMPVSGPNEQSFLAMGPISRESLEECVDSEAVISLVKSKLEELTLRAKDRVSAIKS